VLTSFYCLSFLSNPKHFTHQKGQQDQELSNCQCEVACSDPKMLRTGSMNAIADWCWNLWR